MNLTATLSLPPEVVSHTIAILAQKGAGKTYTAMKLAELMLSMSGQMVALDPTGVWWGLKADGSGSGFPILVIGGEHGDIELPATSGEAVADFVVESGQSVVIDLSGFNSNAEQDRFVTDFAERLFRAKAKSRTALHLMLDEADSFAPQKPMPGQLRMLGAIEAIVRRGRSRGLGMTMISQRPAVLNKNVLTQADLLVALRVVGVQDHKALTEWTSLHGTREQQRKMIDALPSLPTGEAFFWSPSWLQCFERGKVLARQTFDSSSTPVPGTATAAPKLARIDIAGLSQQLLAAAEDAKENDPKALKAEVVKLRKQLIELRGATCPPEVLNETRQEGYALGHAAALGNLASIKKSIRSGRELLDTISTELERITGTTTTEVMTAVPVVTKPAPRPAVSEPKTSEAVGELAKLPKAPRKIMETLATGGSMTKRKLGMLTGYSSKGGGFNNALTYLRNAGFIGRGEPIDLLPAGSDICTNVPPLPKGRALHEFWLSQVAKAERAVLLCLIEAYPRQITKDELALRTGYESRGGGFNNALSRLRTMDLIEGGTVLKACDDLF